jgi:hypothetical protein
MLDLENGMAICSRCHCLQKFSPEKFQDKIIEVIGDKEYQRLKVKSQRTWKPLSGDLLMMKDYLKCELKRIENDYGIYKIADEVL